ITTLDYWAEDVRGNTEPHKSLTIRIDKSAPAIGGMPAASCSLWPPNHQLVTVANVTAQDSVSGLAGFTVTASSNEPENGTGDGDTSPDSVITGGRVDLRAERSN